MTGATRGTRWKSRSRQRVLIATLVGLAVITLVDPLAQRGVATLPSAAGAALLHPRTLLATLCLVLLAIEAWTRGGDAVLAAAIVVLRETAFVVAGVAAALLVLRLGGEPVSNVMQGAADPSFPTVMGAAIAAACVTWAISRAAALAAGHPARRPGWSSLVRTPTNVALLAGAVVLGLHLRWEHLLATPNLGLSLDAQSYYDEALGLGRTMADTGETPIQLLLAGSTWFREPLYVFLLQAWLALLGPGVLHAVLLSLAASLLWVVASGVAIGVLLGRAAGVATAYLLAADAIWIRNAIDGLREEVTGLLLVAGVGLLWHHIGRRHAVVFLAPLSLAGAALTRADSLPFGIVVLAWTAVAQRWPIAKSLAVAALFVAALLPVYAGYSRSRGEAVPSSSIIATANWREEFADRMGTPGFEWDRRITATEYLFSYHSLPQLAWYTARGVTRIYAQEIFDSLYYAVAGGSSRLFGGGGRWLGLDSRYFVPVIFCAGTLGLLLRRRLWRTHWLPATLCLIAVLPPIGFIAGVPQDQLYQARYAYMAAPFASGIVAWAVVWAGNAAAHFAATRRLTPID